MHVVTNNQLAFPGVCHICEASPREDQTVVDTEREYYDNGDDVTGRKYVCDECVHVLADKLGYVHEKTFKLELLNLQKEIEQLRMFEQSIASLMPKEKTIASA